MSNLGVALIVGYLGSRIARDIGLYGFFFGAAHLSKGIHNFSIFRYGCFERRKSWL